MQLSRPQCLEVVKVLIKTTICRDTSAMRKQRDILPANIMM
jgi:hypothetical protein